MARDYDIVLFGATGFTGELVAEYLHGRAPAGARLAFAGRSEAKLKALLERLGATNVGLLIADAADPESLRKLAESTKVVISTVGPYLRYGEALVGACAAAGTDYVDLCGEPEFVDRMYLRHHTTARASGARLIHACGFDSVPYDLGALFTVDQLPDDVPVALQGFARAGGSISGGTFHSAVGALARMKESGQVARQRGSVERNADDGRLAEGRSVRGAPRRAHREPLVDGWVVPVRTIDPLTVLRTARLDPAYGPDFSYSHFLVTKTLPRTVNLALGVFVVATLAQLAPTRNLLLRWKRPGKGPDAARREKSFFKVVLAATYGPAESRQTLVTEVRGGDPGYGETSKMLAEAALALAFDQDLPEREGGQWTPALALGRPYLKRLMAAGIQFVTVAP